MDLRISDLMERQKRLQEKHAGEWAPLSPETGRNYILWMMEEIGEVISIIKKRGDRAIMEDESLRADFVEELADVMMFYQDLLICYGVTPDEWSRAFIQKHEKNLERDFTAEHESYLK